MSIARDPGIEQAQKAAADAAARNGVEERLADARLAGGEEDLDRSLRPRRLGDFVNQEQVTAQLEVFIEAARRRGEPLDHVLLAGPPGLGKTSLANIVAAELNAPLVQTAGPALERKADIAAFLTALEPGSVFFIDRGNALPGHGGAAPSGRAGPGSRRANRDPRPAALHAGWRHHPHGPADDAASRPFRGLPPARALRPRRPGADRGPLGRHPGS
jgi:Holliday junction DNA resolvase RuvB-like protein